MPTQSIGIIGGTGKLGAALARRWLKAGLDVSIGSRNPEKAHHFASELTQQLAVPVKSGSNSEVAAECQLLVITVPFAAQEDTLIEIRPFTRGKIVVDTTVPLVPPKVMRAQMPLQGCAAVRTQELLGTDANVISAFHNVAAHRLATDEDIGCDVMVFGDDKSARERAIELAKSAGLRGIHAGVLANSVAAESLTSILIFINKHYSVDGAGIQFTGQLVMHDE